MDDAWHFMHDSHPAAVSPAACGFATLAPPGASGVHVRRGLPEAGGVFKPATCEQGKGLPEARGVSKLAAFTRSKCLATTSQI